MQALMLMTPNSSSQTRPWSVATWIAIGTVIVVAVLTGAVSWRWQRARALTADSNRRVASANAVLTDLIDMETGQRGFLLVGEARYLEPYAAASERLRGDLATLRQQGGASREGPVAEQVSELARHKASELDSTIALQRTARHTEAVAIVRTNHRGAVTRAGAGRSVVAVITLDELVRVTRLAPSVGPFTLRRLFLRVRVFENGTYSTEEVRTALPEIRPELREILPPADYVAAVQGIDALLEREDRLARQAVRT